MIGIDTSAIIDIFKGKEKVKAILLDVKEPLALTTISYLELMFGIDPGNQKHKLEEQYYDEFFKSFLTLNLDNNSCKKASEIFWKLKRQGKTIEQFDCVIAGIFQANGINKLISKNSKHFENIPNLNVIAY
ncbi:type II toxin-antitoxin system VapC family toxin [Candidatus Woesearchaeota archaeon]|nr:type II toxin-antitoxin system VapC family toxin [Candidatus Woesearchaeota archaeon]